MAKYTGPKSKIARKFGEAIFGPDKVLSRKNFPPGQHGKTRKRKSSEYGMQLREKQKAKYTYGVLEKQFRNLFEKASRTKGIKGQVLLQLLESRLDNVVYRLGIAPTRAAAKPQTYYIGWCCDKYSILLGKSWSGSRCSRKRQINGSHC